MMRRKPIVLLLLTLSGCTGQMIEKGMNSMLGQPVNAVFARLGFPDGETMVAGRKAYIWANQSSGVMPIYTPTTTTGFIGNRPVSMTTSTYNMMPINNQCQIRVIVSAKDIVESWDYRGNQGGCRPYASRLNQ
jgi:hypothetical protein